MQKVVGVRFKKAGKVYYFDPGDIELSRGEGVVVETARGLELGSTVVGVKEVPDEEVVSPLKKVIRKASDEDQRRLDENEKKSKRAFQVGQEKIAGHGLPMKLVDVEYTFDNSKIIFYFTAEGRVDFRELVKDLAGVFRTRIELRQIGVRDEAKMLGGLGTCGRDLCCRSFLGDFEPVSIRMAKDQNLSLNPTKISGICGRLMCCLKFESESYKQDKRERAAKAALAPVSIEATPDGTVIEPVQEPPAAQEVPRQAGCPKAACGGCEGACPTPAAAPSGEGDAATGEAKPAKRRRRSRGRRRKRSGGGGAQGPAPADNNTPEE